MVALHPQSLEAVARNLGVTKQRDRLMSSSLMLGFSYLVCVLVYGAYAFINYSEQLKLRWWYFPLGLSLTLIGNFFWLLVTKITSDASSLLVRGIVWDLLVTAAFIVTPFVFYGMSFSLYAYLGLAITVTGIMITKIAIFSG